MSALKPWTARGKQMRRQKAKMIQRWRARYLREGRDAEYAAVAAVTHAEIARFGIGHFVRPVNATAKGWDRNQPTDMRWLYGEDQP